MCSLARAAASFALVITLGGCAATSATTEPTQASLTPVATPSYAGVPAGSSVPTSPGQANQGSAAGNLGPWNVTVVADKQETKAQEYEESIAAGFTRHVLTLSVENVSSTPWYLTDNGTEPTDMAFIGGQIASSEGFLYPQEGPSPIQLPPSNYSLLIPPGFRVPAILPIDVASNAQGLTVSLSLSGYAGGCPPCELDVSLASVPSSGSVSFVAPGALPSGSTLTQGPLSFTVTGLRVGCWNSADEVDAVMVHVANSYGYPLVPRIDLEVFDAAGHPSDGFANLGQSVPPGGSIDVEEDSVNIIRCPSLSGTYTAVLILGQLLDPVSAQPVADAQTYVLVLPAAS